MGCLFSTYSKRSVDQIYLLPETSWGDPGSAQSDPEYRLRRIDSRAATLHRHRLRNASGWYRLHPNRTCRMQRHRAGGKARNKHRGGYPLFHLVSMPCLLQDARQCRHRARRLRGRISNSPKHISRTRLRRCHGIPSTLVLHYFPKSHALFFSPREYCRRILSARKSERA